MKRWLSRFVLTLSAIVALVYAYLAWRLALDPVSRVALALPFLLVWLLPIVYWVGGREKHGAMDDAFHVASYLSMAWLNFVVVLALTRDVLLLVAWVTGARGALTLLTDYGPLLVFGFGTLALAIGVPLALLGPKLRQVVIPIDGLHQGLDGLRIVQISDLHVGPTLGERYVRQVVAMSNELDADLVVLTGDIVDGQPRRLARHVAPLGELRGKHGVLFVLGNHDCYSGAAQWIEQFRGLGMKVLLNEHHRFEHQGATVVVGGVTDPALRASDATARPRADLAAATHEQASLRVLLAHNPALAAEGERAGFDLQLSGHTHAGQFFPWTLAVRLVHAPHVAGLSRRGRMWVYVSAGTGSWGPPVRFGTEPELTLVRIERENVETKG